MAAMDETKLAKMFKALAHPNRLRLFTEIRESGARSFERGHTCLLQDVMEALDVGAPTVSHHLKELVSAELIATERDGKFVRCRVNSEALDALKAFFRKA